MYLYVCEDARRPNSGKYVYVRFDLGVDRCMCICTTYRILRLLLDL